LDPELPLLDAFLGGVLRLEFLRIHQAAQYFGRRGFRQKLILDRRPR
jgi:hypothetical protein